MQSMQTKIESYPAPTHVATEADLSPGEAKAITETVNPLIADHLLAKHGSQRLPGTKHNILCLPYTHQQWQRVMH